MLKEPSLAMKKFLLILLIPVFMILPACSPTAPAQSAQQVLRIAVLPIVDTLPMYVAQQEGLFADQDLAVELIPVASAPERDQLLAAGQADGAINESLAVMLFNQEQVQMQVVRYALRPATGFGHFFILASGESGITTADGLKGVEIGVSEGTVIEYVTDRLLEQAGLTAEEIRTIAVPRISDRMALLAAGELQAGVLPDPLASLAVQQGSVVVADDSAWPEYGSSVYSFRADVIAANPEAVRAFLAAIETAVSLLNENPEQFQGILSEQQILPESLLDSYAIPPFPGASVPPENEWQDGLKWLQEKGLLQTDVSWSESVNGSLLP